MMMQTPPPLFRASLSFLMMLKPSAFSSSSGDSHVALMREMRIPFSFMNARTSGSLFLSDCTFRWRILREVV